MQGRTKSKGNMILAVFAALLMPIGAAILWIGNLLFDFALNPRAGFSMKALFRAGNVDDKGPRVKDYEEPSKEIFAWYRYCEEARNWYEKQKQTVSILSEDGLSLTGWKFSKEGHRYVIVCHGYAGVPEQMAEYAKMFFDLGFSVLTPVAQGHEGSDGAYYGMGWKERRHIVNWVEKLVAEDSAAEIVLFGVSMGGATVMMTAGEELPDNVKCIIEDCGYSSVWDEFALQLSGVFELPTFPLLPLADMVCRVRAGYGFKEASAVEQLKKAKVPMLFIHGEKDTFVPYSMLDLVYDACASREKERLTVPDATHGVAAATDPKLYWDTVAEFLRRYVG
ncbi:MAG: alpha/beta hydrolase [Lachnospiraceae bacterium]